MSQLSSPSPLRVIGLALSFVFSVHVITLMLDGETSTDVVTDMAGRLQPQGAASAYLRQHSDLLALRAFEMSRGAEEALMVGAALLEDTSTRDVEPLKRWLAFAKQRFTPIDDILKHVPKHVPFVWRGAVYVLGAERLLLVLDEIPLIYYPTSTGFFILGARDNGAIYNSALGEVYPRHFSGYSAGLSYDAPVPKGSTAQGEQTYESQNVIFEFNQHLFIETATNATYLGGSDTVVFYGPVAGGSWESLSLHHDPSASRVPRCHEIKRAEDFAAHYHHVARTCAQRLRPKIVEEVIFPRSRPEPDLWRLIATKSVSHQKVSGADHHQEDDQEQADDEEDEEETSPVISVALLKALFEGDDEIIHEIGMYRSAFFNHERGCSVLFKSAQGKGQGLEVCSINASEAQIRASLSGPEEARRSLYQCTYIQSETGPHLQRAWKSKYFVSLMSYFRDEPFFILDLQRGIKIPFTSDHADEESADEESSDHSEDDDDKTPQRRAELNLYGLEEPPEDETAYRFEDFTISPQGSLISFLSADGALWVYELSDHLPLVKVVYPQITSVDEVSYINEGEVLIASGAYRRFNLRTGEVTWTHRFKREEGANAPERSARSPNQHYLAILNQDTVYVLDLDTGAPLTRPLHLLKALKGRFKMKPSEVQKSEVTHLTVSDAGVVTLKVSTPTRALTLERRAPSADQLTVRDLARYSGVSAHKSLRPLRRLPLLTYSFEEFEEPDGDGNVERTAGDERE